MDRVITVFLRVTRQMTFSSVQHEMQNRTYSECTALAATFSVPTEYPLTQHSRLQGLSPQSRASLTGLKTLRIRRDVGLPHRPQTPRCVVFAARLRLHLLPLKVVGVMVMMMMIAPLRLGRADGR